MNFSTDASFDLFVKLKSKMDILKDERAFDAQSLSVSQSALVRDGP